MLVRDTPGILLVSMAEGVATSLPMI